MLWNLQDSMEEKEKLKITKEKAESLNIMKIKGKFNHKQ